MTDQLLDPVTAILRERDGLPTIAIRASGQQCIIYNMVWGRDIGAPYDHITTNVSPAPECKHEIDFFHTVDVDSLLAPESGVVLYQAGDVA